MKRDPSWLARPEDDRSNLSLAIADNLSNLSGSLIAVQVQRGHLGMFLLRCAFWLSVMYACASFGPDVLPHLHASEASASERMASVDGPVALATRWCVERAARCADDAARLTALVVADALPEVAAERLAFDPAAPRLRASVSRQRDGARPAR